jgi:hypothetical protein
VIEIDFFELVRCFTVSFKVYSKQGLVEGEMLIGFFLLKQAHTIRYERPCLLSVIAH